MFFVECKAKKPLTNDTALKSFCEAMHLEETRQGRFYSCNNQGKVPFAGAFDTTAVAYCALLNVKSVNTDFRILRPHHYTYDQIRSKVTIAPGRGKNFPL